MKLQHCILMYMYMYIYIRYTCTCIYVHYNYVQCVRVGGSLTTYSKTKVRLVGV